MKEIENDCKSPMVKWCHENERSLVWLAKKMKCTVAGLHHWCRGRIPKSIDMLHQLEETTNGEVTLESLIEYKKQIEANTKKKPKDK